MSCSNKNLKLSKEPNFNISYKSLAESLQDIPKEQLSLNLVRNNIIKIRRSKLPDPEELGNAGSFFKNPVVPADKYEELKEEYPEMPANNLNDSEYKLYAGWLIDKAGLKGKRIGDVESFNKQALVIVNHGSATGSMILEFAEMIVKEVKSKFGLELIPEVNVL